MNKKTNPKFSEFNFWQIFEKLLLIIPLGALINIIIAYFSSPSIFPEIELNFSLFFFIIAMVAAIIPWITHSIRMHLWSRYFKKPLKIVESFQIALATELGSAITPTAVGGGYIKIGLFMKKGFTPAHSLFINFLGSIEDALFFIIALPITFSISKIWSFPAFDKLTSIPHLSNVYPMLMIILSIFILILIVSKTRNIKFHRKLIKFSPVRWSFKIFIKIRQLFAEIVTTFKNLKLPGLFLIFINTLLAGLQWTARYTVLTFLLFSVNFQADPILFFSLQWIQFTLLNLVPTPGAIGGAEASFFLFYQDIIPSHLLAFLSISWRFCTFYFLLGSAIILYYLMQIYTNSTGNIDMIKPIRKFKKLFKLKLLFNKY